MTPSTHRPRSARRTLGAAGLAGAATTLAASTLVAVPGTAGAVPAGTGLVISEVYGGGGNTGAPFTHDFIELYNPTDAAIPLAGHTVEYFSAAGGSGGSTTLTGSVPARGHYLVQEAPGAGGTAALPTPDAVGTLAMSGANGSVALKTAGATLDLVGYGTATLREGSAARGLSNTTAATRDAAGTDTDDNAADFTVAAPAPQASGATGPTDPTDPPDPGVTERSIAQIQGEGATSPLVGQRVRTSGVVTAVYATGGLNGFVLQTPDSVPGAASHGLFVYTFTGARAGLVAAGDHVQVSGPVAEYKGATDTGSTLTQVTAGADADIVRLQAPATVTPAAVGWPATESERERLESMLVAPTGAFTVTDNYSLNNYAEIGLAAGTEPLRQPTDVAPYGSDAAAAEAAKNQARRVTLDDGATINFLGADANKDIALPWLTDDPTIRVGESATFAHPVIVDYRNSAWKLQPTAQLTAGDTHGVLPARFGDTRRPAPRDVGGDLQVASFNVLNYFPTTGDQLTGCTYYDDRDGDHVSVRGGCNARGAAEREDFLRQQAKIVTAINGLGAEVVSLEEIENSAKFLRDRDAALADLVDALNARAGAGTWAYVPSPLARPSLEEEDFIRTGFIYQPAAVHPVGSGAILSSPAFGNAREPLAQAFQPVGSGRADRFLAIVNHFKSKGCGTDAPGTPNADNGQGCYTADRVAQARALVAFADAQKAELGVEKVYLDGDFNSYTFEDPMRVLYDAGYTSLEQHFDGGTTYLFNGLVGSLDHGLANAAALATTTGATVWDINADESVALEYSRHNYNVTDFYAETPFRSSDHDPIVFGLDTTRAGHATAAVRALVTPRHVVAERTRARVHVLVGLRGHQGADGIVEVREDGVLLASGPVRRPGVASVRLPVFATVGEHTLTVRYFGDSGAQGETEVTVRVSPAHPGR